MFINLSNHPSVKWGKMQLEAAMELTSDNQIKDIPFPAVPATATTSDILAIADGLHHTVMANKVVAACSDRCTKEVVNEDGTTTKTTVFEFIQFREFPKL